MKNNCAFSFRNGLAPVCKNGKFGIINKKAETVVDFSFDRIVQGSGGVYLALREGKWGIITVDKEFMPAESTTSAETAAESGDVIARGSYTVKTAGSILNMREAAYAQSAVVAKIPNGAVIDVTKSVPGWAYAKYNSFSGWVSAQFLVPVAETSVSTAQTTLNQ
jgi:uncharacterized protein YgiM (DUF1202 family)